MPAIQFPSMTSKSPIKRVNQVLLASSNSPSWNEKPPWEGNEHELVDSQISVSTKLSLSECPPTEPGIQITDTPLETAAETETTTAHDEYHSCTEDLPAVVQIEQVAVHEDSGISEKTSDWTIWQ